VCTGSNSACVSIITIIIITFLFIYIFYTLGSIDPEQDIKIKSGRLLVWTALDERVVQKHENRIIIIIIIITVCTCTDRVNVTQVTD